eukprot:CAMPEP_0113872634 /NCGR_PEP_ID=MMETSP0780_2-20120614/3323_1 /TAXON_ID=652834 /ORGANISM="Palpitomonas bilix" /LENGTH=224 /DNA_ID=CAMNT_0000858189 /DNA_START=99 /DNA_END=773 /DNA_ORIENTATION=+ /assembly_acc=CAM_ASM_000599
MAAQKIAFFALFILFWGVTAADDACSAYTNCVQCDKAYAQNCGWCQTNNECMKGSASGPDNATACPPSPIPVVSNWRWDTYECNEYICQGIYDCNDCVRTVACGWCEGSSSCQYANENDTAPLYPQDAATCGTWVKQFDQCPGGQVVLGLTLAEFILLFIVLPVAVVAAVTVTLCICMRKKIRNLRNMSTVQFTSTLSPLSSPRTDVPTPQTMPLLHSKRRTPF